MPLGLVARAVARREKEPLDARLSRDAVSIFIALGAASGPERATEIVTTLTGREERNTRLAHSRRRWDAGYGVTSLAQLSSVVAFFERRGRLHGSLARPAGPCLRRAEGAPVSPFDQVLGAGDGARATIAFHETYGGAHAPYVQPIAKPVAVRCGWR